MHYLARKFPGAILAGLGALVGAGAVPAVAAASPLPSAVNGAQLTELGSVPLPPGATPAGVAVK